MEAPSTEKKWFVYLGDHHEGPLSVDEVRQIFNSGKITPQHYVWREGMGDWQALEQVTELFGALQQAPAQPTLPTSPAPTQTHVQAPEKEEPSMILEEIPTDTASARDFAAVAPPGGATRSPESTSTAVGADPSITLEPTRTSLVEDAQTLSPKERKRLEKQEKKARKQAEKERKKRERFAERELNAHRNSGGLSGFMKLLVFLALLGGLGFAYTNGYLDPVLKMGPLKGVVDSVAGVVKPPLMKISENLPFLSKWISPIPPLPETNPSDYEALKSAAMAPISKGPKVAIAFHTKNLLTPQFYVASNLPDGTRFKVHLIGRTGTLLNQLEFEAVRTVTIKSKWAKSEYFRTADSNPIPRGDYDVFVYEAIAQGSEAKRAIMKARPVLRSLPPSIGSGKRVVATKSIFLGGTRDQAYTARLSAFHDKLQKKSADELLEIRNFMQTLFKQYNETVTQFGKLRRGRKTRAKANRWNRFSKKWTGLNAQFEKAYTQWTTNVLEREYYHGDLYEKTKTAGLSLTELHRLQTSFFGPTTDAKAFENDYAAKSGVARGALLALQKQLKYVEGLGRTPTGLPRRK